MSDRAPSVGARISRSAEVGLGALLRLDERVLERVDPLPAGPVDPESVPWAGEVRAAWPDIRAELDALLAEGVRTPGTNDLVGYDQGAVGGAWTTYVMTWYGRWLTEQCRRCPATTSVLRRIPRVQVAGFTVLGPHTRIPRHQGPMRALRWQMGMRVPGPPGAAGLRIGEEVVPWAERTTAAFDDRTPHEAWNDADEPRYVLFIQVPWPAPGAAGVVHRSIHRAFGLATSRVPRQAEDLDRRLNPTAAARR